MHVFSVIKNEKNFFTIFRVLHLRAALLVLRKRHDALGTLDLSRRISDLAARLRVNIDQRQRKAVELWAIQAMTKTKFASSFQQMENHREVHRRAYEGHIWRCSKPRVLRT